MNNSLKRILLLDALALLIIATLSNNNHVTAQQLDGGVFNSPEAQKYWNRRLGKDTLDLARKAAKKFAYSTKLTAKPEPSFSTETTTTQGETTTLIDDNQTEAATMAVKIRPFQRVIYVPKFIGTYGNPSPFWMAWTKTNSVP